MLRKLRRLALWGLAGVMAAVVALLAALWVSALADPVPSRRFTYRDGTLCRPGEWTYEDMLGINPDTDGCDHTIKIIPVRIAANEWADLVIIYELGNGSIAGIFGVARVFDRTGECLWSSTFEGLLEDLFKPDCWWLRLADVDGDGRAEAVVTIAENEEGETWTKERCLKTVAVHTQIERLDGKQTPVDAQSLSRWRRLRFNLWRVRTPDDVPGCGDETESESPDEEVSTSWHQSTAGMNRIHYADSRAQEQARQERLRACAAPYPADIRLLVDEAYDAAKRYAERDALQRVDCTGSGAVINIIMLQEKICERVVSLIEHVCTRRLEALPQPPEPDLLSPHSAADRIETAFSSLFARLLPDIPVADVRRHVAAALCSEAERVQKFGSASQNPDQDNAYLCGKRFIALQNASETHFSGPGGQLHHAAHENALLQDMALDLMLLEEGMLTPIPGDERRTWDEYRRLCGEVTALIASASQGGLLPDAAAFAATQEAWEAYCRAFIAAASPWNDLVTKDVWLVWLLEKRILQLRRLAVRMLEPSSSISHGV